VFRVFARHHPQVALTISNANAEVTKTISRARAG
jgi:hypothetical protein